MEARVWSDERVMKLLEKDYIICALYVDDKTKLSKEDYYVSQNGITLKELGTKNLTIATERWGAAQQPAYVLLTPDGEEMLASSPLGYETDIDAFVNYLKQGLDNLDKDFTYPTDSHGVLSAVEVK
jgi:thiol:disulfide interchange protein DsbD